MMCCKWLVNAPFQYSASRCLLSTSESPIEKSDPSRLGMLIKSEFELKSTCCKTTVLIYLKQCPGTAA